VGSIHPSIPHRRKDGGEGWWGAMVDGSGVHAHLDGAEIVLQALRWPEMFGQVDWLHTYTIEKREESPGALLFFTMSSTQVEKPVWY
jgi:hypothetical protein